MAHDTAGRRARESAEPTRQAAEPTRASEEHSQRRAQSKGLASPKPGRPAQTALTRQRYRQRAGRQRRGVNLLTRNPYARGNAERPAYLAASSSSSSMRSSWLYLLTRSPRAGAPVLIWPAFTATDRSAIVTSSVSPERWEIAVVYPLLCAREIASRVSETVPIWFSLTSSELAELSSMPLARRSGLVTNRSSPTIWTLSPTSPTSVDHPCQSSSSKGSSMEISG